MLVLFLAKFTDNHEWLAVAHSTANNCDHAMQSRTHANQSLKKGMVFLEAIKRTPKNLLLEGFWLLWFQVTSHYSRQFWQPGAGGVAGELLQGRSPWWWMSAGAPTDTSTHGQAPDWRGLSYTTQRSVRKREMLEKYQLQEEKTITSRISTASRLAKHIWEAKHQRAGVLVLKTFWKLQLLNNSIGTVTASKILNAHISENLITFYLIIMD